MIELTLSHDTEKVLKGKKRRYADGEGHNLYLEGPEVEKLGEPKTVKVTVEAAE